MRAFFLLCSFVALGCLDFDAARETCKLSGNCLVREAPTLISTVPASQAANVDIETPLTLTFSKAMSHEVQVSVSPPVPLGASSWSDDDSSVTLLPNAPFAYGKGYTVVVSGQATDGTALGNTSFAFTTRPEPDKMAPSLISTTPANNTTNVPVTAALSLSFSEAMNTSFFELSAAPDVDLGEPVWSNNDQIVTFSNHAPFEGNTAYQLTLLKAQDTSENDLAAGSPRGFSFISGAPPDLTPPTVVSASPPAGSIEIDVNTSPSVSFSEPMAAGSAGALRLLFSDGGFADAGCINVFDPSRTLLTCTHASSPLKVSTGYWLTVAPNAADQAGNAMDAGFSLAFTTGATPDVTRPTVVSVTPSNGAQGVFKESSITVTFSEPMDKFSVEGAGIEFNPPVSGTYSWDATGKKVTFNPTSDFSDFQQINWQVNTAVKDLSGLNLMTTQSFSFRTAKVVTLSLPATAAESGYLSKRLTPSVTYSPLYPSSHFAGETYSSATTTYQYRSFASFNLGLLPAAALRIRSASFDAYQSSSTGSPWNIGVDRVSYPAGASSAVMYEAPEASVCPKGRTCFKLAFSSSATAGPRSLNVTGDAQDCLESGRGKADGGYLCKFRIAAHERSPVTADNYAAFRSGSTVSDGGIRLLINYEAP